MAALQLQDDKPALDLARIVYVRDDLGMALGLVANGSTIYCEALEISS